MADTFLFTVLVLKIDGCLLSEIWIFICGNINPCSRICTICKATNNNSISKIWGGNDASDIMMMEEDQS